MTKLLPQKRFLYCVPLLILFSISTIAETAEQTQLTRADRSAAERSIRKAHTARMSLSYLKNSPALVRYISLLVSMMKPLISSNVNIK